jgi:tetratricopeptide (TPR) repeat protein
VHWHHKSNSVAEASLFRYRAFLSYSHRDKAWGEWLHRALESFRIEKDLVGRITPVGAVPKALRPIFRDREDFSAGHSLTEQTIAALEASEVLIVVCSPHAARSPYVNEEIRRFKALGRADRVIPVIVDGEPGGDPQRECFPAALRFKIGGDGQLASEREEPIAADAREEGDGKDIAKLKVVAGMLGLGLDEIVRRAERARKRRARFRNAIVASLIGLTVSSAAGFVWARYELARNEALLDRTLERATALVNRAVAMSEGFGVPRTVSIGILEEAEGLFRDMAELGRETQQLRYRKARMLIEFARNYEILGNTTLQHARASEAHGLMRSLTAEDGRNLTFQRELSVSYTELGDALRAMGRLEEALANYRAGRAVAEPLAAADRNNTQWQRDLSIAHERIGDVLIDHGRLDEALASYRLGVVISERLAATDPSVTKWQHDLAVSHEKIGNVLRAQKKLVEALASYRGGLAILERLAAADGGNATWQRDLSVAHDKVGVTLADLGRFGEALASYRASLAISERLTAADPSNAQWKHDLSVTHERIGDLFAFQRKPDEALTSYRTSIAIRQRLATSDPSNATRLRDIAILHGRLAVLYAALGRPTDATAELRQGRTIMARLVELSPSNAGWKATLAWFDSQMAGRDGPPQVRQVGEN